LVSGVVGHGRQFLRAGAKVRSARLMSAAPR
jgi:hypothetical protein